MSLSIPAFIISLISNSNLARFHNIKGIIVLVDRGASTAICVNQNGSFRIQSLKNQRIRYNANISANTANFDCIFRGIKTPMFQFVSPIDKTKSFLVDKNVSIRN